jgi:hypothetical protein
MTHCELAVQISASKSKYYRELMRFQNSMFSRFYMKIEKALELFYFRKIFKFFGLDLFDLAFKRAPRDVIRLSHEFLKILNFDALNDKIFTFMT